MDAKDLLDIYYNDISDQYDEWVLTETLPEGYEDYTISGVYEADPDIPELYEMLASKGCQEVLYIAPSAEYPFSEEFIGIVVGNELRDVTQDIERITSAWDFDYVDSIINKPSQPEDDSYEDYEDWSEEAMLDHGADLYATYGGSVDVNDMSEYDAECYLMYVGSLN